jgi:hypothetical protein
LARSAIKRIPEHWLQQERLFAWADAPMQQLAYGRPIRRVQPAHPSIVRKEVRWLFGPAEQEASLLEDRQAEACDRPDQSCGDANTSGILPPPNTVAARSAQTDPFTQSIGLIDAGQLVLSKDLKTG